MRWGPEGEQQGVGAATCWMGKLEVPTEADVILALGGLCLLLVIGAYVITKFRGGSDDAGINTSDLMTNFRQLRAEGDLSDEEFRTIKSMLSERLRNEVRDSGDDG